MGYYQELVVKPLEEMANAGIGKYQEIGQDTINKVYSFEISDGLLVTSMHHANEVYGTWQSVLRAISYGAIMNAVPVVNADGFDYMYEQIEGIKKISRGDMGFFDDLLHESLVGYKDNGPSPILYPPWRKWNYGGTNNQKPSASLKIEEMIDASQIIMDIHNCPKDGYIIIAHPTNSKLQHDVEEIVKQVIKKYSNNFYGIVSRTYGGDAITLGQFAGKRGKSNIVLEVPSFTIHNGYYVKLQEGRILDTNVEIMLRLSEYIN